MKLISTTALLLATLLTFTGCDQDTDDACVYGVQLDLDKGNYDSVVSELENNGTCNGAMDMTDSWLNLAAAYNGKAGLTVSKLLGAVIGSDGGDPMLSFMTSFAASATPDGLLNLEKARNVYAYIDSNCEGNETGIAGEACLFDGLSTVTQAVGSLTAIIGEETLAVLTGSVVLDSTNDADSDGTADSLQITSCAILYGVNNNVDPTTCTGITVGASSTPTIGGTTYHQADFAMTANGISVFKLLTTATPGQLLTTNGGCQADRTACTPVDGTTCYPCPVESIDGNDTTVTSGLLDVINNGDLDSLGALLPANDDGTDANITADMLSSMDGNTDGTVTEAELAAYLSGL